MQENGNETNQNNRSLPLAGIKVLELGSLIAGPFAGRLFADFGAEVVKVEPPGKGDPIRTWRLMHEDTSLWWYVQSRNKKSVTIDLRQREGQQLVRRLVEDGQVDLIIENFKPGTLEKWGIGYEDLKKIDPKIIMVRVSGYGQNGPYRDKPGFGTVGEAMGGLRYITGYPDRPPVRVGVSIGDSVAGLYAVIGAMMALYHRDCNNGEGQYVDVALYEAIFSLMESTVPEYDKYGFIRERTGSTLPGIAPTNSYLCKDDKYVVIGGNGDGIFKRLMKAIGKEEFLQEERFSSNEKRARHAELLDSVIEHWTKQHTLQEALHILDSYEVPAGAIYNVEDMMSDSHFAAREMIVDLDVEGMGSMKIPGIVPKLSATPGRINWAGPKIGEHNGEIMSRLGITKDVFEQLKNKGII